jgi:hypothetical protein
MSKLLTAQQDVITELILDNKKLQTDLSRVLADYYKDSTDLHEQVQKLQEEVKQLKGKKEGNVLDPTPETDAFAEEEAAGLKSINELYGLCRMLERDRNDILKWSKYEITTLQDLVASYKVYYDDYLKKSK